MAYSALAHVKGAPPAAGGAGGPAGKAVAGKVVAGKSAAEIRAAAAAAVRTHILAEAPANETDAAADAPADAPAGGSFAKDPSTLADAPESQIDAAAKAFAVTPMLMSNGPDVNTDKVLVKLYMESQCPACRRFSTTYLKDIVEAPGMSDILDLEFVPFGNGRVIDPSADPNSAGFVVNHTSLLLPLLQEMAEPWHPKPAFQIVCQHGIDECMGNALEACVQDVQPDMRISFPVLDCIENRGCPEDTKPPDCVAPPQQVAQGCVVEKGQGKINVPQLLQCMQGTRSQELMIMNDVATLNANIQWAPWITVDGEDLIQDPNNPNATVSFREMFLLGKKICDTYASKTGKEPPVACAKLPQTDADIPAKPYDNYPQPDFTEFIAKQKANQQLQEEHQKTLLQEEKEEQYLGWAKMAVVPVLLVVAGAIFAYMVFTRKPQEEQPETEKLVGDKQAEEHV